MDQATYPEVVAAFEISFETSNPMFQIKDPKTSDTALGGQPFLTPPYLVLHREEFAWPRVSPRAPVRSYIKPVWAAPFHPSPRVCDLKNSGREF